MSQVTWRVQLPRAVVSCLLLLVGFSGLSLGQTPTTTPKPDVVQFTILQLNDVYEINPLQQGKIGGLARVATIRQELLKENPNTLTVLAGDLFSPSPMGNAPKEDPWEGKQMVAMMNTLGVDLAVLGNHEFDLRKKDSFLKRIAESRFRWISANVTDEAWSQFPGVEPSQVIEFRSKTGSLARVGFLGLTTASTDRSYVRYRDPVLMARRELDVLGRKTDLTIGLTHLDIDDDVFLSKNMPGLHFIIGGHEHDANYVVPMFPYQPPIAKADANAKSVWIHRFSFDLTGKILTVQSSLRRIDDSIADEPSVRDAAKKWTDAYAEIFTRQYGAQLAPYKADGPPDRPARPDDRVKTTLNTPLEGRDGVIRSRQTNLGQFIAGVYRGTLPPPTDTDTRPRVAIFNSGSVRIDDVIGAGTSMTFYDVLRILPFTGEVKHTTIKGIRLLEILDRSENSLRNTGAYLQYSGIQRVGSVWRVERQPGKYEMIVKGNDYFVAMSDYLWKGDQKGFDDLKGLPDETKEKQDIQTLVAKELANSPVIPPDSSTIRTSIDPNRTAVIQVGPTLPPLERAVALELPTADLAPKQTLDPAPQQDSLQVQLETLRTKLAQQEAVETRNRWINQLQLGFLSILLLLAVVLLWSSRRSRFSSGSQSS